ncbi:MAG: FAD-dependent thymidylate synthase [Planctomycetes bacterium]|nr:FAD-dependent thymidylate synthase [Planctomycetota bacterium]
MFGRIFPEVTIEGYKTRGLIPMPGTVAEIVTAEPVVRLLAYTAEPFDLSVASARSCYSPKLIFTSEVRQKPEQRDRIAQSIFEAGHHTPFQHPTFVFGLENISRQAVWSFFHSHPYYNSEQSSQRYNVLNEARVFVPPLEGEAVEVYRGAILEAWRAYNRITEVLMEKNSRLVATLGRVKGQSDRKILSETEKKAIEMARYVVPIAAFTSMVHTLSAIELYRYVRMMRTGDTPHENNLIVPRMVQAVREVDPDVVSKLPIEAMDREKILEERLDAQVRQQREVQNGGPASAGPGMPESFDRALGGHLSRLVASTPHAEEVVAEAIRQVAGAIQEELSDSAALECVLNPAMNPYLLDTLNAWHHSPLMRTLNHASFTFLKKLSHTADSQDQRHRAVPGSRPLLTRTHTEQPDYITPEAIREEPGALEVYVATMEKLWAAKNRLLELGVPAEFAVYVLPNSTAIRFTESGTLLGLLHKWRMRTCFLAQREIYEASMDELLQARAVYPRLTYFIGPPCVMRDGLVEPKPIEGPCPEGPRYCGIEVWRRFPKTKRPF